nr:MAG TPA: hypothetical protein [Caudoviricetes sp.]
MATIIISATYSYSGRQSRLSVESENILRESGGVVNS